MRLSEEAIRRFKMRNHPLRRILVNSVPKSGTTWVRTMLAALPGYESFPMDGRSGTHYDQLHDVEPGQIFHGHIMSSEPLFEILEKLRFLTVFIFRDLRDVVVSNYFHWTSLNPRNAPESMRGRSKDELLRADAIMEWCPPVKRYPDIPVWIGREDVPTTTYEALSRDTAGEMERVLEALGFHVDQEIVRHIVDVGSFERVSGRGRGEEDRTSPQRKGVVGDWRRHFSDRNKEEFKQRFGHLLIEMGYEEDFNW